MRAGWQAPRAHQHLQRKEVGTAQARLCPPCSGRHCERSEAIQRRFTHGSTGLLRRFRLRSLSYGGQVAPRNDVAVFYLQKQPRPPPGELTEAASYIASRLEIAM